MRIIIHINTSWNIYNFRLGLVQSFLEKGYEVWAVAPKDDFSEKLQKMGCKFAHVKMDNKGVNPIKDLQYAYCIWKIFKQIKPTGILLYTIKPNIYATLAATLLKIPVINNVSGLGTVFIRKGLSSAVAKILYRFALRFSKLVFFQNNDDKDVFFKSKLISPNKTALLPGSGIDLDKFRFQTLKEHKKQEKFIFLLVARLIYNKGIKEYVQAAQILQKQGYHDKMTFQILGKIEKDAKNKLNITEEQVQNWQNEGSIAYIGETEDVIPAISQADCVVLPSYREGTPKTLLEAAAMGKPLIGTDVAGCREVVRHHQNGLLCQAKNPQDLALKMKEMYEHSHQQRTQMGFMSRKLVEDVFDEKIVVQTYQKAIEKHFNPSI